MLRLRQPAMLGAAVDPTSVAFKDLLEVGPLDPLGQLVGDVLERPAVVEVERERLLAGRDDLGGEVVGLDLGAGGGHDHLLDDVLELADVPRPLVAGEPRKGLAGDRLAREPSLAELVEEMVRPASGRSSIRSRSGGSSIETTLSR